VVASGTKPATVAVDVNPATRAVVTGTEVFTREVAARLPAAAPELRWRFFASRPRAHLGVDVVVLPNNVSERALRPGVLWRKGSFGSDSEAGSLFAGRLLTVVHDLAFERHPVAYQVADRAYLRLSTRWAVSRSRLLIAISESTKHDLVDMYGVAPERIRVVPLGISAPAVPPAPLSRLTELGLNGSFVLQVGRVEPRKNQSAALAAVERLDGVTLVIAGPERDADLSERLRNSAHCRVLGMVDQPMLELLYRRAAAVVVPSLYEGFGLPVLEAMARGKVVVAAKSSSLPEVGGEGALYFHQSAAPDQLASVLEAALGDQTLRTKIARAARARAARFTWDKTAAAIAAVIRELLSS